MRVFHRDQYVVPLPPGHRFPMEKYRLLRELLLARGVLPPEWLTPSTPLGREDLARVHPPRYLDALFSGTLTEAHAGRRLRKAPHPDPGGPCGHLRGGARRLPRPA